MDAPDKKQPIANPSPAIMEAERRAIPTALIAMSLDKHRKISN